MHRLLEVYSRAFHGTFPFPVFLPFLFLSFSSPSPFFWFLPLLISVSLASRPDTRAIPKAVYDLSILDSTRSNPNETSSNPILPA